LVSKWAPLGSRATTLAGRGRNRIQEGAEEREPSEVAANARIKFRGVICQVRRVICQVERQRAGKNNAEAKLWIEAQRVFCGSSVAGVSASVSNSSVATGSPSQADFFKTGQVDAGVLEEGRERSQADKLASIDGMRAEVQQLRATRVAAGGGDAGGG